MILEIMSYFDWTWVVTGVLAAVTYFIGNLLSKRKSLPPGPIPIPILGNLLSLRGNVDVNQLVVDWRAKYGDVFTVWLGNDPFVVITGYERIKEAFVTLKNSFSGRHLRLTGEMIRNGHDDVIFTDYSPRWEVFRKIMALAVRKYSTSEKLPVLVDDVVKQTVQLLLEKKGPFDPTDQLYFAIYNVIATTALGKRYTIDDPEFIELKNANDDLNNQISVGTIYDLYPFLKHIPIIKKYVEKPYISITRFVKPLRKEYEKHRKTYKSGTIRDFTDACLAAKEEAEIEDSESSKHFTDGDMTAMIVDLFLAGTDTTRLTLTWALLYLCKHPEKQEKLRAELLEQIGSEAVPVQSDRLKCPYTMAVITETLRHKPVISFTLEHKAIQDTDFAGYKIKKGTSVISHIQSQHMDPAYFKDPEAFRPERFLEEDGTFMTQSRFTGYLPFGVGRRACPGEKLALADLFLVMAGLFRKVRFSLPGGPDTADFQPLNLLSLNIPKPFNVIVEKVNN